MRKVVVAGAMLALILGVTGCATSGGAATTEPSSNGLPQIDPSLIPTAAPASVIDVP
ncbi:MAG: hypothetical protein RJA26_999, partial [Actinomycetota bacterium]